LNRHPALSFCWSMIFPKTGDHFSGSCSSVSATTVRPRPARHTMSGDVGGADTRRRQSLGGSWTRAGLDAVLETLRCAEPTPLSPRRTPRPSRLRSNCRPARTMVVQPVLSRTVAQASAGKCGRAGSTRRHRHVWVP
jgi:hypothetical protein